MFKKGLVLLSCFVSFNSFSKSTQSNNTTTYAYCVSKLEGDYVRFEYKPKWRWALDENNNYVIASGNWEDNGSSGVYRTYFFNVTREEFSRINRYCNENEYARPADNANSNWYEFKENPPRNYRNDLRDFIRNFSHTDAKTYQRELSKLTSKYPNGSLSW
jgi:hypothetical protein